MECAGKGQNASKHTYLRQDAPTVRSFSAFFFYLSALFGVFQRFTVHFWRIVAHFFPDLRSTTAPRLETFLITKTLTFQQAHHLLTAKNESILKSINQGVPLFRIVHVRHPFQRLYSAWLDKFVSCRDGCKNREFYKPFEKFEKQILKFDEQNIPHNLGKRNFTITFRAFVLWLTDNNTNYKENAHWQPMYQLCSPCAVRYDFISHLETIEADNELIYEKLRISGLFEFPHANKKRVTTGNKEVMLSLKQVRYDQILRLARLYKKMHLTSEMLYKLYDFYKLDFELYGYNFTYFMQVF